MKQVVVAGIFTLFGIFCCISSTESSPFYDGLSSALKSLQQFFSSKNADLVENPTVDENDMESSERGERVKRSTREKPVWKLFFIKFWKAFQRMSHPHFYQNFHPVPFVPVKPTARTPPPTTPDPNEHGHGAEAGHNATNNPSGTHAPGAAGPPAPAPAPAPAGGTSAEAPEPNPPPTTS